MSSLRSLGAKALVAEAALVLVIFIAWLITFLAVGSTLEGLSPAGRAFFLVNWFTHDSLGVGFAIMIVATLAVPLRRVSPLGALVLASACITVVQWRYPLLATNSFVQFLILAVLTAWASWKARQWWWVIPILAAPIVALGVRVFAINDRFEAINASPSTSLLSVSRVLQEILLYSLAIGMGLILRRFSEQSDELEQRNEELEAERANTAAAAVVEERLRISRELHDVVAHHVTTMTVHAGAARQLVDSSPDQATESLLHIESAGRSAVNELHQLLGYLRGDDADGGAGDAANGDERPAPDRTPTPSLRHLDQLRQSVAGKLDCTVDIQGDLDRVPTAVDVSAYRIVQEALTNAMKHSSASSAHVEVMVQPAAVEITVIDRGAQKVWTAPASGSGHGVVGMRERATLHGGYLEVGPLDSDEEGSGWKVWALLPFGAT